MFETLNSGFGLPYLSEGGKKPQEPISLVRARLWPEAFQPPKCHFWNPKLLCVLHVKNRGMICDQWLLFLSKCWSEEPCVPIPSFMLVGQLLLSSLGCSCCQTPCAEGEQVVLPHLLPWAAQQGMQPRPSIQSKQSTSHQAARGYKLENSPFWSPFCFVPMYHLLGVWFSRAFPSWMGLAFTLQSQSNKGGKNTLKMGFITTKSGITGKLGGCRKTQAQVSVKQCYHECKTRGTTKAVIRTHNILISLSSLRQEKGANTEENPLKNLGHE